MHILSVIIITLNEERNIGRCLESVKWADEIIVVDSGSTDKTIEISESYGAKVYKRGWSGDAAQRNFGIDKATGEWCLVLDADEEVTTELSESIKKTLENPTSTGYKIHRRSYFLGKILNHGDWGRDWIVRLFLRKKHLYTLDIVHSKLDLSKSNAGTLDGKLIHYTQESIYSSVKKLNDYSTLSAKMMKEKGKGSYVLKAVLRGNLAFLRSYVMRAGFLDGIEGYICAKNIGLGAYLKYIKRAFDFKE